MKARAASCGESSLEVQPSGKATLPESPLPAETWMSLKTMRPQTSPSIGVGKEKYWTTFAPACCGSLAVVIQDRAFGCRMVSTVCSPSLMEIWLAVGDAPMFESQSLRACPLGNDVSTVPVTSTPKP